jgi:CheY-like chemotaxis protein
MSALPRTILVVEDNPDDAFFMRHALKKAGITDPVRIAEDGQAALDYLSGTGKYSDRAAFPLPNVIFLDLKLPGPSGFEVLSWIYQHPALRALPVYILTGSSEDRDREQARQLGARDYFVKPPDPAILRQILRLPELSPAPA